jgi:hypothetical protein
MNQRVDIDEAFNEAHPRGIAKSAAMESPAQAAEKRAERNSVDSSDDAGDNPFVQPGEIDAPLDAIPPDLTIEQRLEAVERRAFMLANLAGNLMQFAQNMKSLQREHNKGGRCVCRLCKYPIPDISPSSLRTLAIECDRLYDQEQERIAWRKAKAAAGVTGEPGTENKDAAADDESSRTMLIRTNG